MAESHKGPLRRHRRANLAEDASQHLWAVSYSDLLMVLMSFFVIYFSVNDSKDSAIFKILAELPGKVEKGNQEGNVYADPKTPSRDIAATQQKIIDMLGVDEEIKVEKVSEREILVHFPNNIFGIRDYTLSGPIKSKLKTLMGTLSPYQDGITLTFVGHTDAVPVMSHDRIISNNLVLSGLRAASAAEYAIQAGGFRADAVSTQGSAQFDRGTRSFSVRIGERKVQ
jgi:flagellar motor protein MotB